MKIKFNNGTLNIESMSFGQEEEYDFTFDYDYDAAAKCPAWEKLLSESIASEEDVERMRIFIRDAVIKRQPNYEGALLFFGEGLGKSTVTQAIAGVCGQNNSSYHELHDLCCGREKEYFLDATEGKMVNISNSPREKDCSGIFKQLMAREVVHAREIRKKPYATNNYAHFIIVCNKLPSYTESLRRRIQAIRFETQPNRLNPLLQVELKKELSGIFNWIIKNN